MGIPDSRIHTQQSLQKARKRTRRKNASTKDIYKKPSGNRRKVQRRHIKMEKILRKEWNRLDFD